MPFGAYNTSGYSNELNRGFLEVSFPLFGSGTYWLKMRILGLLLLQHGQVRDLVLYGKRLSSCEMFE